MTAKELKDLLQNIVDNIDDYLYENDLTDDVKIEVSPNTMGVYPPLLGTSEGWISLDPIHIKDEDLIECVIKENLNDSRGYHQVQTKYGTGFKYDSPEGFVNFCEDWDNGKIDKDC